MSKKENQSLGQKEKDRRKNDDYYEEQFNWKSERDIPKYNPTTSKVFWG